MVSASLAGHAAYSEAIWLFKLRCQHRIANVDSPYEGYSFETSAHILI